MSNFKVPPEEYGSGAGLEPYYNTIDELKLEKLAYLRKLQREAEKFNTGVAKYYDDPIGFAENCIDWGNSDGLTFYQLNIVQKLKEHHRVAVRGPHGLGKSTISAFTILWFALTRDANGVDWKAVYTAGAWRQLINYLSPEIHKWAGRIKWDKVRDRPFTNAEMLNLALRLQYGSAFAAAASNPALIEGAHADSLLFIYDESKSINAGTFDACEGAFSGTGETYAMALSTPGPPQGRFYDIHARKPGYEDWCPVHVTLADAIKANRISQKWADQRKAQWGEHSALYQNRVLGEFYSGDEDSVIPLSWVEAANERWHEWNENGRRAPGKPMTVGVDVARSGDDKTCLAVRDGHVITEIRSYSKNDTMTTTGNVMAILEGEPERTAIVDVIGIGAGVYDRLKEMGARVQAFNAAATSYRRDKTGEMGFSNARSAAWWNLRELLDPSAGSDICLPPDDSLLGDLTAPHSGEVLSGGKIKIESKKDIKKRIGRSTDKGDAVVQAFWTEKGNWHDAYGTVKCTGCRRGFMTHVNGSRRSVCPFCGAGVKDPNELVLTGEEDDA